MKVTIKVTIKDRIRHILNPLHVKAHIPRALW